MLVYQTQKAYHMRKRNRRRSGPKGKRLPKTDLDHESDASKAYTAGKSVKYGYRINGPTFPVHTFNIKDH